MTTHAVVQNQKGIGAGEKSLHLAGRFGRGGVL